MLYHYTDRVSAEEIVAAGLIRACPITLHRDPFARDKGLYTAPIVWLSINPILDGTVATKLLLAGWSLVGDLYRVVLPAEYSCQSLPEYSEAAGIEPAWWEMSVATGRLAGSDYTTWRIVAHDIRSAEWLRIEKLAGIEPGAETRWETT